jgi:sugar/nucleoside kinase (ribokinase family)
VLHLSISSGSRLGPYEIIGSLGAGSDVMLAGALAGLASGSNIRLALISWNSVADGAAMTGSWSGNITSPQILGIAMRQWSLTMQKAP